MASKVLEVFISSRFEEFEGIRKELKNLINANSFIRAIDLNDNLPSHKSPLVRSLVHVKQSDFFVLLVGDSYGEIVNNNKSYIHLEYEAASSDNSNTTIIVFFIGDYPEGAKSKKYSSDPKMKNFQMHLEKNHTISYINKNLPLNEIVGEVYGKIQEVIFNSTLAQVSLKSHLEDGDILDEILIENNEPTDNLVYSNESEVFFLEKITSGESFDNISKTKNEITSIDKFIYEQNLLAKEAIDMNLYNIALHHLEKAFEEKPADLMTNYRIVILYLILDSKKNMEKALKCSINGVKISQSKNLSAYAATFFCLAARCAEKLEIYEDAKNYAAKAVETADNLSINHIEYARQLLNYYDKQPNLSKEEKKIIFEQAKQEIETAISIHPYSIKYLKNDAIMNKYYNKGIRETIVKFFANIDKQVKTILEIEMFITNTENAIEDIPKDLKNKAQFAKDSINRSYEYLKGGISKISYEIKNNVIQNKTEKYKHDIYHKIEEIKDVKKGSLNIFNVVFIVMFIAISFGFLFSRGNISFLTFIVILLISIIVLSLFYYFSHIAKNDKIAKLKAEKLRIEEEYNQYINEKQSEGETLLEKLKFFEENLLNKKYILNPFKSLHKAKVNEIVRVSQKEIQDLKDSGIEVDIDPFPDWIDDYTPSKEESYMLYKLLKFDNKIVLSRKLAYLAK